MKRARIMAVAVLIVGSGFALHLAQSQQPRIGRTDLLQYETAAAAHGEHEKRTGGQRDENWPDWYAEYMVSEQAGTPLPT